MEKKNWVVFVWTRKSSKKKKKCPKSDDSNFESKNCSASIDSVRASGVTLQKKTFEVEVAATTTTATTTTPAAATTTTTAAAATPTTATATKATAASTDSC